MSFQNFANGLRTAALNMHLLDLEPKTNGEMVTTITGAPIDILPPELLQTVWRHLPFLDLLHCQQVCTLWKAYLPGSDPALRAALFSEIANPDEEEATNYFSIWFDVKQELIVHRGQLPQIRFLLSADSDEHYTWGESGQTKNACFHPLVGNLGKYMDVIHPRFERRKDENWLSFSVLDFKGLNKLAEPVECKVASWENMQITTPPMQGCSLYIYWYTDPDNCTHDGHNGETACYLENELGITVGQIVEAIREILVKAEELIKQFTECLTQVVVNRVEDIGLVL